MKSGKICFIHMRDQDQFGDAVLKGGATIAWNIDESGDIRIGRPAICNKSDPYVKSTGRQIAEDNLRGGPLAITITKMNYVNLVLAQLEESLNFSVLTKNGRDSLKAVAIGQIEDDIFSFMSSSWFESLVRGQFQFDKNHIHMRNGDVYGSRFN